MTINNRNKTKPRIPRLTHAADGRENYWYSYRPVPAKSTRLQSGELVGQGLFDLVVAGIRCAALDLKPGHPYKAKYFIGPDIWEETDAGFHRRAGRVLADIARRPDSPIGLIARPKGGGHRYFVRPTGSPTSSDLGLCPVRVHQPQP